MKQIFSLMMLVAFSICMNAQVTKMYVWKNGSYTVCPVEDVDSITFAVFDYKAVDLGLPSGTLWADRNVGADTPEAYGDYFAWGEVFPKKEYNWKTYKWCNGSENALTKYCTISSYGIVDGKTIPDLEDDAAYVNMGAEWRMPTTEEQQELYNYCTWIWTTIEGVNGYKLIGPNGNFLFLPVAGYRYDCELDYAGSLGFYWSSTLNESSPYGVYLLDCIVSGSCGDGYCSRCYGYSVRAVAR